MKKILMMLAAMGMMAMPVFLGNTVWAQNTQKVSGRDYSACNKFSSGDDPAMVEQYNNCKAAVNACYNSETGEVNSACLNQVKQQYSNNNNPGDNNNPGNNNNPGGNNNSGGGGNDNDSGGGAKYEPIGPDNYGGSDKSTVNTTIFGPVNVSSENGGGIFTILNLVLNILTVGVGIAATIGFVIAGIQYLTAQDNEAQVAKAKMRMFQIVIGLFVYATMWAILNWILPGGVFGDGGTSGS